MKAASIMSNVRDMGEMCEPCVSRVGGKMVKLGEDVCKEGD